MRRIVALGIALTIALLASAAPPPQNVTYFWQAPTNYPAWQSITWKLYTSPDVNLPRSNWTAVVISPTLYTNGGVLWYSNIVVTVPGQLFVGLNASNFWEVPFTNAVALPPAPPNQPLGAVPGP